MICKWIPLENLIIYQLTNLRAQNDYNQPFKKPINGIVRQLPFPIHNTPTKSSSLRPQLSIDKKMLVNGTLQNKFPEIAPGDQLVLETSFVIIQNGEFEWYSSRFVQ